MANEILSPNYILPDNDVWLLKRVPLENNYEDTIIWQIGIDVDGSVIANEQSADQAKERQFNYFTATVGQGTRYDHLRLPAMTYLREGRKYLRVDLPYTRAIQYNYLIFKNNGAYTVGESTTAYHYEHRYYYAFITGFEYINDKTTLMHYEIDLMQTYNFDYELKQCFIEREHSATDNPGDNLVPEQLDIGVKEVYSSYACQGSDGTLYFPEKDWTAIVIASVGYHTYIDNNQIVVQIDDAEGNIYNGIYSGLRYNLFSTYNVLTDTYDVTVLNMFLRKVIDEGKESAIASIVTMPTPLAYNPSGSSSALELNWPIYLNVSGRTSLNTEWVYARKVNNQIVLDKPKNKKLYTQPFTDLVIYNGNGEIATYGLEYFLTHTDSSQHEYLDFKIYSNVSANPEITCVPFDYKGVYKNYMEKLDISSFPQCAYTIDAYRAWLAQNKARITNTMISGGLSTLIGATSGNVLAAGYSFVNLFNQTAQIMTEGQQHAILPPQIKGSQTPYLSISDKEIGYKAYVFKPVTQYAKIIDDYFDLYGYATHEVKIPNRTVRPTWCYTKTVGCRLNSINRGIPADVDDAIRKIYDNGIRFWKDPAKIGNYTYGNAPAVVIP